MKKILVSILVLLTLTFSIIPFSFAEDGWKQIINDSNDSRMEADIEVIYFKEDEQFFYIKFESRTNWNLFAQKGSLFMYFDMYGNSYVKSSTAILAIEEYELDKYAVGFLDMMNGKLTECENDFRRFSDIGIVKIPREAILNKFYKFSFLCVLGNDYWGDFDSCDICPDGGSMMKYTSKFCPDKAILVVTKSVIDFGSIRRNRTLTGSFQIFNSGTRTLNARFEKTKEYISINPSKITLEEFRFDTIGVGINTTKLEPKSYSENIDINSNGGNAKVIILYEILNDPILSFEPQEIDFSTVSLGEKANQVIKIGNKVKGIIEVKLSTDLDCISLSKRSFNSESEEINLMLTTKKLIPGEYKGILKITSDGGNANIPIKFNIVTPLTVNKEIVDFGKVYNNNLKVDTQNVVLNCILTNTNILKIESDVPWIKLSETEFDVSSGEIKEIKIDVDFSQIGSEYKIYTGNITFLMPELDFKLVIKVQIEMIDALPEMEASIEGDLKTIEGELVVGDKFSKKIIINNKGGQVLKVKAFFLKENPSLKLNKTNLLVRYGSSVELIITLDSSNLEAGILSDTLVLDSNGGKIEIPISITLKPKAPIIITLKIGTTEAFIGNNIVTLDAPPYIKGGTTFVPLRFISEAFGAKVEWKNQGKGRVIIYLKKTTIVLDIGSKTAFINNEPYTLLVPPEIVNGRTFVPVRFISEGLGAKVKWLPQTQEVIITFQP